jgi:hypothetical protein
VTWTQLKFFIQARKYSMYVQDIQDKNWSSYSVSDGSAYNRNEATYRWDKVCKGHHAQITIYTHNRGGATYRQDRNWNGYQ